MEQFLEQDKLSCAASLRKTWKTLQGGEIDGISCLDFFFFFFFLLLHPLLACCSHRSVLLTV